jgi:galactokinase/mevalonate kinase-like predicted kinase
VIIGRSPLRISLGGGGTDLPSYYRAYGGFVVSAAITQYVRVTMHRTPLKELLIRYSQIERPARTEDVKHPIIREARKSPASPTRTSKSTWLTSCRNRAQLVRKLWCFRWHKNKFINPPEPPSLRNRDRS